MKFPYAMLRDFVNTTLDANQIGDLLTMAGFELEGIEEVNGEPVLDIKVMSNRGDGLSVFGLSREVLAKDLASTPTELYLRAATRFQDSPVTESLGLDASAATIESETCNRFALRSFKGVSGTHSAPNWIQQRLTWVGMRPISLLVDLTNYVMLELGQPLHAFDRAKLSEGRIVVRSATPGEKLTTLNGIEHELSGQMMICDAAKPVGVPGVMGGLETEVTEETTEVLLESANFTNTTVRKTRKQLGLATEASYRFERSVDPEGVIAATRRFTELLLEVVPTAQVSNIVDLYPRPPERIPVRLRPTKASMLLGMDVSTDEVRNYLQRLGMVVHDGEEGTLIVTPPSWRPDIIREEDLVEEIGRVHGYDRIPEKLPEGSTTLGGAKGAYRRVDIARDSLLRSGFIQMISHSLRADSALDATQNRIAPRNPASPEHAALRDALLPCLADAARRNGSKDLHLFEIGKVFQFAPDGQAFVEKLSAAILSTGNLIPTARQGEKVAQADFFSLKESIVALSLDLGLNIAFVPSSSDPRFHPTRQATVVNGDQNVGVFGQIHPEAAASLDLLPETFIAELEIEAWVKTDGAAPKLKQISRNPATKRDIAILIDKSVSYDRIEAAIETASGDVLEMQWLFDVYSGQGIEPGKHSLGIGLQFRKLGENFTDEEANQVRDRIVAALVELGARPR